MQIDHQTLHDLGIFNRNEEDSIFHLLDRTTTSYGREQLKSLLSKPLDDIQKIQDRQEVIRFLSDKTNVWPKVITNGTLLLIDKYYKTRIAPIPYPAGPVNVGIYRTLNATSYGAVRYSVKQFMDFVKGIGSVLEIFDQVSLPALERPLSQLRKLYQKTPLQPYLSKKLSLADELNIGHIMLTSKSDVQEALKAYGVLDAWLGVTTACTERAFQLPVFLPTDQPHLNAIKLFHPMLDQPVPYDIILGEDKNFLFLTGANMAGKSTFIKAVGLAVYLAHLGIGVPAQKLELSYFDGLFSNIQITDNILHGESYFFNEVKRVKDTIERIQQGRKWLVLIDELFKGTNVQDAMRCSVAVIEGFRKVHSSLFLLSSHLYEIAEELQVHPNIMFRYFETKETNESFSFSYQLKEGVSKDRIGYLILQREGVTQMLQALR